jgi:hypothetical protein
MRPNPASLRGAAAGEFADDRRKERPVSYVPDTVAVPFLFLIAVLGFVALLRLAFGVAHASVYRWFSRQFARASGRLAVVGKTLSLAALLLPAGGFVSTIVGMVSAYQALPPGGLRRLVEIPILVLAGMLFESVLGLVVSGMLLALLWLQGRLVNGRT